MLELGLKITISYLLGAINGALVLGALKGVDIRTMGSGNAGGTNALRTQGKAFAAGVMVIDILKGVLPVLILPGLAIPGIGIDPTVSRDWLAIACAGAAVVGHCYPVWFGFQGGKGAATAIGVLAVLSPVLLIPALIGWVATLKLTKYVGLATIVAAWSVPVWIALTSLPEEADLLIFSIAMAAFILFTHRSNVRKILSGEGKPDLKGNASS